MFVALMLPAKISREAILSKIFLMLYIFVYYLFVSYVIFKKWVVKVLYYRCRTTYCLQMYGFLKIYATIS